jgi:hypothetical protein
MPLASMSKVTSICGMPRGAGGMFSRLNWPRSLLSAAISRSPWNTRIVTAFWLSSAVEKICPFLVGIVVLRSIRRVKTPPSVSIPSDSGRDVEQHHVLHVALQHAGLDGGTHGDDLVGVHALVRFLAEELRHFLDRPWACGSCRRPGSPRRSRRCRQARHPSAPPCRASSISRSGRRPGFRAWRGSASSPCASGCRPTPSR